MENALEYRQSFDQPVPVTTTTTRKLSDLCSSVSQQKGLEARVGIDQIHPWFLATVVRD